MTERFSRSLHAQSRIMMRIGIHNFMATKRNDRKAIMKLDRLESQDSVSFLSCTKQMHREPQHHSMQLSSEICRNTDRYSSVGKQTHEVLSDRGWIFA